MGLVGGDELVDAVLDHREHLVEVLAALGEPGAHADLHGGEERRGGQRGAQVGATARRGAGRWREAGGDRGGEAVAEAHHPLQHRGAHRGRAVGDQQVLDVATERRRPRAHRGPGVQRGGAQRRQRPLVGRAALERRERQLADLVERGERDLLLVGEVPEEGAHRDLGADRDRVDRGRVVAVLGEQRVRGVDDRAPGALLLELPQPARYRLVQVPGLAGTPRLAGECRAASGLPPLGGCRGAVSPDRADHRGARGRRGQAGEQATRSGAFRRTRRHASSPGQWPPMDGCHLV